METNDDLLGTHLIQINNTEIFWAARRLLYSGQTTFIPGEVGYLNE